MKKKIISMMLFFSICLIGTIHAQTEIEMYPVFDTYWHDSNGDGIFDTENGLSGDSIYVGFDPTNEDVRYRIALEFDLSTLGLLAGMVIERAEFTINWGGFSGYETAVVDVLAYQGNGDVDALDFTPTVIESWSFTGYDIIEGEALEDLNVTAFIQSLVNNSQDYAGFTLAGFSESQQVLASFTSTESDREDRWPKLKITYSDIPPPEPNIDDTIDFFVEAVDEGTISGRSTGFWGQIQLSIMRSRLISVRNYIERGQIWAACFRLRLAHWGCDGTGGDLVEGETDEAEVLHEMIYDIAVSHGCWWASR